ncbi:MAG: helix-turn-helix domain-containing protein [Planctomycetota bacterium]
MPRNPYASNSSPLRAAPAAAVSRPSVDTDESRRVPPIALDQREACRAIGVSDATLRDMIRRGVVPAVQVGRRWLIPIAALTRRLGELAEAEADARRRQATDDNPAAPRGSICLDDPDHDDTESRPPARLVG